MKCAVHLVELAQVRGVHGFVAEHAVDGEELTGAELSTRRKLLHTHTHTHANT